ncbi:cyclic nucleotide-binding domain-containing protein [Acidobacteriota bacterium]
MAKPSEILKIFPLFTEFSDQDLEILGSQVEIVKFNKGDYLFQEGDEGDAVYLLYEGTVVADKIVDDDTGARKDLAIIPSGTFFGEMGIIDGSSRSAGIRAEINVETLKLTRAAFRNMLENNPYIAFMLLRAFYSVVSTRLRATNDELVAIYDIGKIVSSNREFKPLVHTVLWRLIKRLESTCGICAILNGEDLRIEEAIGSKEDTLKGLKIDSTHALIDNVLANQSPLLIERFKGITEPWESESMIIAPLISQTKVSGLILLGERQNGDPYTPSDLNLVAAVANICSPAIEVTLKDLHKAQE